jgi:hypothetical protein
MWIVGYHHFEKNLIKFFFIKRIFSLVLHKINFGVLKFKSVFIKTNTLACFWLV